MTKKYAEHIVKAKAQLNEQGFLPPPVFYRFKIVGWTRHLENGVQVYTRIEIEGPDKVRLEILPTKGFWGLLLVITRREKRYFDVLCSSQFFPYFCQISTRKGIVIPHYYYPTTGIPTSLVAIEIEKPKPKPTPIPVSVKRNVGRQPGKKLSAETKAKISKGLQGRPVSPETKAKLAASNKGKKQSDEHKAKLAAARKRRIAKNVE